MRRLSNRIYRIMNGQNWITRIERLQATSDFNNELLRKDERGE